MEIILARHGNTFGPDDRVVWTGAGHDLPLVSAGVAQARALGQALRAARLRLTAAYCGPLSRTRDTAQIALDALGQALDPIVDARLDEIDYGQWTGLSDAEIVERFGRAELEGWNQASVWPASGGWRGSPEEMITQVRGFAHDLRTRHGEHACVLVVTSNGRLRYFLTLVEGEWERRVAGAAFKVKTGCVGRLRTSPGGWELACWNETPAAAFPI